MRPYPVVTTHQIMADGPLRLLSLHLPTEGNPALTALSGAFKHENASRHPTSNNIAVSLKISDLLPHLDWIGVHGEVSARRNLRQPDTFCLNMLQIGQ